MSDVIFSVDGAEFDARHSNPVDGEEWSRVRKQVNERVAREQDLTEEFLLTFSERASNMAVIYRTALNIGRLGLSDLEVSVLNLLPDAMLAGFGQHLWWSFHAEGHPCMASDAEEVVYTTYMTKCMESGCGWSKELVVGIQDYLDEQRENAPLLSHCRFLDLEFGEYDDEE